MRLSLSTLITCGTILAAVAGSFAVLSYQIANAEEVQHNQGNVLSNYVLRQSETERVMTRLQVMVETNEKQLEEIKQEVTKTRDVIIRELQKGR